MNSTETQRAEWARIELVIQMFPQIWEDAFIDRSYGTPGLPRNWQQTIGALATRGLDLLDLAHYAKVASRAHPSGYFRYFCGCCWTGLRERAEQ